MRSRVSNLKCDDCWHSPAVSVFISIPGGDKKARLFQYERGRNRLPEITSIDDNRIRVSLSDATSIYCRKETWGKLRVEYDIGSVEYHGRAGDPHEC